jgi:hypothetical protein
MALLQAEQSRETQWHPQVQTCVKERVPYPLIQLAEENKPARQHRCNAPENELASSFWRDKVWQRQWWVPGAEGLNIVR